MNTIPATLIQTATGLRTLKDIAVLDHSEWSKDITDLPDDNALMFLQGDRSSKLLAVVLDDSRLTIASDSELLMDDGTYKRAYSLLLGDKLRGRTPTPLVVTGLRRIVGNILSYVMFSTKGHVELYNGVRIKTSNALETVSGAKEKYQTYLESK